MEYIQISDSRLKVLIEKEELERLGLTAQELDYSDPDSKWIFEDILTYARQQLGFVTSDSKVLLRLFPSKSGGCELFVTRVPHRQRRAKTSVQESAQSEERTTLIFSFDELSALLRACRTLMLQGFEGESSVWVDRLECWYLTLKVPKGEEAGESRLCEFGRCEKSSALSLYLSEYGSLICKRGAVAVMSALV